VQRRVQLNDKFIKSSMPRVHWTVDRFMKNIKPPHVVLNRLDEPQTCLTVSVDALMNERLYNRIEGSSADDF
jgi:hypothetical protein